MPRLTEQQVEEFYKIHNTPPWVISHCRAVGDVGAKIASALNEKGGDFDVELISKVIDGEITREEAFKIFNASIGING